MREVLIEVLEHVGMVLPLRRFFLPDGGACPPQNAPPQEYDRLLILIEGEKFEKMSLSGELQTVHLLPGDAYLIRKNVWENCSFTTPQKLLCIVNRNSFLRISFYDLMKLPENGQWYPPRWYHHTGLPVSEAFSDTMNALKHPAAAGGDHLPHLIRALALLAASECRRSAEAEEKSKMTFHKICGYLDYHYTRAIGRESLAERFGVSPSYVSLLFRRYAGKTFQNYLTECRISLAKRLLTESLASVKEISARCGFESDIYFVRRFRELHGMTPGQYRIQNGF